MTTAICEAPVHPNALTEQPAIPRAGPTPPLGWINASCIRCRSRLCFWQQFGPDLELNCAACGQRLASRVPPLRRRLAATVPE